MPTAAILSAEDCQKTLSVILPSTGRPPWQPYWVARYSVLIKARGVIKTKGFTLALSRANK